MNVDQRLMVNKGNRIIMNVFNKLIVNVESRQIRCRIREAVLMMVLCLSTACSSFKDFSLFKSKSTHKEKFTEQSSGQTRLFDYSELTKSDSSFFNAWIWVDGGFSFHRDSGIKGEKALIQYFGKSNSFLQFKDSLISQKDSSSFTEYAENQIDSIKDKERKTKGYYWLLLTGGILLGLWLYYRNRA